jgi:hypothetical protein
MVCAWATAGAIVRCRVRCSWIALVPPPALHHPRRLRVMWPARSRESGPLMESLDWEPRGSVDNCPAASHRVILWRLLGWLNPRCPSVPPPHWHLPQVTDAGFAVREQEGERYTGDAAGKALTWSREPAHVPQTCCLRHRGVLGWKRRPATRARQRSTGSGPPSSRLTFRMNTARFSSSSHRGVSC